MSGVPNDPFNEQLPPPASPLDAALVFVAFAAVVLLVLVGLWCLNG